MRIHIKVLSYLSVIVLYFASAASYASPASSLTDLLNSIKTMQASYVQTVFDNYGKPVKKSSGTMALERPGKFRWQEKKPMPQLIIANKSKLWVYDPDLEQVTVRSLTAEAGEAPALLLSHKNTKIEKDYDVSSVKGEDNLQWFLLKPKKEDAMFSSVKMGFDKKQIKEMDLDDQIGHSTRVVFNKIKTNQPLPAKLFEFKAPKGTDVIDETS